MTGTGEVLVGEDDGQSHCCSVHENCTALTFVHIHCSYYTVYLYSTGGANCLSRIEGQLNSVYATCTCPCCVCILPRFLYTTYTHASTISFALNMYITYVWGRYTLAFLREILVIKYCTCVTVYIVKSGGCKTKIHLLYLLTLVCVA